MAKNLGLYGGTFDPIHNGHLLIARSIAEQLALDAVVFLPSASPPHKKGAAKASADLRAEMVRLAIADEPGFALHDFDLHRSGPSYTIETIEFFKNKESDTGTDAELYWIIGADWIADIGSWYRAEDLIDACRIVTASRAGASQPDWEALCARLTQARVDKIRTGVIETPIIEISSTQIRSRIRDGLSIRHMVPDSVCDFLVQHSLYLT